MGNDVKISVIATGFDSARPLKRIEQPIYKRQTEPRAESRPAVAAGASVANGAQAKHDEAKSYDPNDLEVPSFLRRR